jgi:hypothetical protein
MEPIPPASQCGGSPSCFAIFNGAANKKSAATVLQRFLIFGVADGARTHDNRNHNPGLYQLSYSHRSFAL